MKPYGVILTGPILKAAFRPSLTGGSTGNTRNGAIAATTGGGAGAGGVAAGACDELAGSALEREVATASEAATGTAATDGGVLGFAAADRSAALKIPLRLSASTRS